MYELINPQIEVKLASNLSSTMLVLLSLNGESAELELSLEGERAQLGRYPQSWVLYSQEMYVEHAGENISYEALIEEAEQWIGGIDAYISRSSEKQILLALKGQLEEALAKDPCPVLSDTKKLWLSKF